MNELQQLLSNDSLGLWPRKQTDCIEKVAKFGNKLSTRVAQNGPKNRPKRPTFGPRRRSDGCRYFKQVFSFQSCHDDDEDGALIESVLSRRQPFSECLLDEEKALAELRRLMRRKEGESNNEGSSAASPTAGWRRNSRPINQRPTSHSLAMVEFLSSDVTTSNGRIEA